nr:hypothetical protein [uncultured bacterium]
MAEYPPIIFKIKIHKATQKKQMRKSYKPSKRRAKILRDSSLQQVSLRIQLRFNSLQ